MTKYLKPIIALVLVTALAIGGTLAYLTDSTETVTNTFTAGEGMEITLSETDFSDSEDTATENDFTIFPGSSEAKDPTVTLVEGSTSSYIYIDVIEYLPDGLKAANGTTDATFADYITYSVTTTGDYKWTLVGTVTDETENTITRTYVYTGTGAVPYAVTATDGDTDITILDDVSTSVLNDSYVGAVTYPTTITTEMLNNLDTATPDLPTLSFIAYAVQATNLEASAANAQFIAEFKSGVTFDD